MQMEELEDELPLLATREAVRAPAPHMSPCRPQLHTRSSRLDLHNQ